MIPFLLSAALAGALFVLLGALLAGRPPGAVAKSAAGPLPGGAWLAAAALLLLAGVSDWWMSGACLAAGVLAAPGLSRRLAAARREKRLAAQLPPFLDRLASTIAAGQGIESAMEKTTLETEEPLRGELSHLVQELRVGKPLPEAMDAWAERVATADARLVATAIRIAQDSGGRLSDALERIAATVRERRKLAETLASLTAQGKMQAAVIGAMPPLLAAFLWLWEPETFGRFYATAPGKATLAACAIFELVGVLWIWKIVSPERTR